MPMGLIAAISKQSETVVKPIFTITRPIVLPPREVKGTGRIETNKGIHCDRTLNSKMSPIKRYIESCTR